MGSLLRHISHVKLCRDFYGPQKLEVMKEDLRNAREKQKRLQQSESDKASFSEKDRKRKALAYKHSPEKERIRKRM